MQGRHVASPIEMHDHTRATLTGWLRQHKTPGGVATQARAIVLLADGYAFAATARQTERRRRQSHTWMRPFTPQGLDGFSAQKRPGCQPVFSPWGCMIRPSAVCAVHRSHVIGASHAADLSKALAH